ncbi:MAG: alcohol dehydrogenase catalytic domain-containing protein [Chloroflexi bacterium]|nr:alcohol dehydrogenase catalytic domain-containing protein [Chloroflexota bacterium]MBK8934430.1 alcohol dehydrogenase catalytic domain-containing protein [Chloroflexota bacterium]MBP6805493.1 alcohol dehydrogenase catalytic domain-containing protein [Chloroflexota bacterium]
MQAVYLEKGHIHYLKEHEMPVPQPGEAVVRVSVAGICATDLELVKGYKGDFKGVPGHEFVGVVERAPDKWWHGRRVVGSINIGCNQCAICRQTGPEHCPNRRVLGLMGKDGAFADYLTLPQENLVAVPDSVPDEAAVFTEPLAAALRIREQVRLRPSAKTAVIGPGRLGLLIGQVLALDGSDVVMIGRNRRSLERPSALGLRTGLAEAFAPDSFDLIVEATGNAEGFATAQRLLRPLGTLVLKSTFVGAPSIDMSYLVVNEITVIGSRCGPFAPALNLLAQGKISIENLLEAEYRLRQAQIAFAHAAQPGVRKVLLRP